MPYLCSLLCSLSPAPYSSLLSISRLCVCVCLVLAMGHFFLFVCDRVTHWGTDLADSHFRLLSVHTDFHSDIFCIHWSPGKFCFKQIERKFRNTVDLLFQMPQATEICASSASNAWPPPKIKYNPIRVWQYRRRGKTKKSVREGRDRKENESKRQYDGMDLII